MVDDPMMRDAVREIGRDVKDIRASQDTLTGIVTTLTAYRRDHELDHARAAGRAEASSQWGARSWTAMGLLVSATGVIAGVIVKLA